jgi:hypothetical protein
MPAQIHSIEGLGPFSPGATANTFAPRLFKVCLTVRGVRNCEEITLELPGCSNYKRPLDKNRDIINECYELPNDHGCECGENITGKIICTRQQTDVTELESYTTTLSCPTAPACPDPDKAKLAAFVEISPGQFQPLNPGDCVEPGQKVRLTATITPAGATNVLYDFDFGDQYHSGYNAQNYDEHIYQTARGQTLCTLSVFASGCAPIYDDHIILNVECCDKPNEPRKYWDDVKAECKFCTNDQFLVTSSQPQGCFDDAGGGSGLTQDIDLTVTPPAGIQIGTTDWIIDGPSYDPTRIHVSRPGVNGAQTNTSAGWSGAGADVNGRFDPKLPGIYHVGVVVHAIGGAAVCTFQGSGHFTIQNCSPCPEGTIWNAETNQCTPITEQPPGTEQPSDTESPPGSEQPPSDGFDFCCILLGVWISAFLVAAGLFYCGQLVYGGIALVIYIIVLAIWGKSCCLCALTFWRCCTLLKWHWAATSILLSTVFPVLSLICGGNGLIAGIYGGLVTALLFIMAIARCGSLPNPLDPSTWPGCRC